MAMTRVAHHSPTLLTIGIDTHLDTHTAVALDDLGRRLGELELTSDQRGYDELELWAQSLGEAEVFGVEGTSSYGAGLTRYLRSEGYLVVEVSRPKREVRRDKGKSDPIDAEVAARAVLAGEALGVPKAGTDVAEMVRVLRVARTTAMKARTQAINAMHALIVTAPQELRDELRRLSTKALITRAARLRPGADRSTTTATKQALRALGQRALALSAEIDALSATLDELVRQAVPSVVALFGAGTDTAGQLLVTAGDNPDRLKSDAAFAMLCGASPRPAGSGKTSNRHRLNRGGDRQANAALYRIVLVRMRWDPRTRDYVERRTKQGLTKREIIRCLKRYIAREVFTALKTDLATPTNSP
jgi:transposase